MTDNIIDKIENYFSGMKEQYGNTIFFEKELEKTPVNENEKFKNSPKSKIQIITEPESMFNNEHPSVDADWKYSKSIEELFQKIHNCRKCPLGDTRKNFVFGAGNPNADIMIIGEAPGADEDEQGEPFVGRAGQLLTKILSAINLSREEVFIANILKCRPPANRKPLPSEEDECEPFLQKQIELIQPQFILALGLTAVDRLLKKKNKMGEIRGSVMEYHGIKMLVTYHPAALLRNPNWKPLVWEDVKLLRRLYDEYKNNK
jgi:uracil-DNA glycosylase